ncbi:MAG: VacJ family lipoprotein [Candidatus Dadabacteria bacterium]|nr:MAG: VacJ family lipoprotein [Candidatus Dadabacteria bacterium]
MKKLLLVCYLVLYPLTLYAQQEPSDPWEGFNRAVFSFNEKFDHYLMKPVAQGYDFIFPEPVKRGVSNFFENIKYPSYLVSDLLQFKFKRAARHTGRFLVNSTLGLGGLADIASCLGLEQEKTDFAVALAYHGIPSGPYLVLPFLGPSSVRDAFGRAADAFLDPAFYTGEYGLKNSEELAVSFGAKGLEFTSIRARLLGVIEDARKSSLDYYLFSRSAYFQYRRGLLKDDSSDEFEDEFDDGFDDDF